MPPFVVSLAQSRRHTVAHRGRRLGVEPQHWIVGVRMSQDSFAADLCRAARRARGKQANRTYSVREQALARLAHFLWRAGFQVNTTGQLKEKHIKAWAAEMVARGRSKRTIANNLAHVRTALEGIKRRPFADKMSNAALGIGGASRAGTKRPMTREELEPYRSAVAAIDPGIATVLELQLEFGLRAEEAVRSVKSLADWERTLLNPIGDGFITVIHGTKGGKTRRSPPLDRARAAELVGQAIDLTKQRGGKLVRKPDLRAAMHRYHYVVRKVGMTGERAPHSLRYAYATEHLLRIKAAGVSRPEAAAAVSTFLGHGDGRGTWVELVYGRAKLANEEVQDA
jgi:site-specific recombinase XerC